MLFERKQRVVLDFEPKTIIKGHILQGIKKVSSICYSLMSLSYILHLHLRRSIFEYLMNV